MLSSTQRDSVVALVSCRGVAATLKHLPLFLSGRDLDEARKLAKSLVMTDGGHVR